MKEIKNIGGIGSILGLAIVIPRLGGVFAFVGFVMVVIAIYKLSKAVGQKEIFRHYLIAIITISLAFLILGPGIGGAIFFALEKELKALSAGVLVTALLCWILLIVAGYFTKKSFEIISSATGVEDFKIAGNFYFIGNILLIIAIGIIISFIGIILQTVAFFSLPSVLPTKTQKPPST